MQPSEEGKTRTPMQKAIVNQYSNIIAEGFFFSFFSDQVNDIKGGFMYQFDVGKSISTQNYPN